MELPVVRKKKLRTNSENMSCSNAESIYYLWTIPTRAKKLCKDKPISIIWFAGTTKRLMWNLVTFQAAPLAKLIRPQCWAGVITNSPRSLNMVR